jgi:hypothetical protein
MRNCMKNLKNIVAILLHSNYFEGGRHLKAWWTTADVVHPTFQLEFCWVENSIPFYTFTIENFNIVSSWSVNHPSQSHEYCLYSIPITCTKPIRTSLHLCCRWTFIPYTCTPSILTSLHMYCEDRSSRTHVLRLFWHFYISTLPVQTNVSRLTLVLFYFRFW